jgi:predicted small secreted protein
MRTAAIFMCSSAIPINQPDRKIHMKKIILTLASLCAVAILTTACNTMEGAGRDIERAGDKIEKSAERHK